MIRCEDTAVFSIIALWQRDAKLLVKHFEELSRFIGRKHQHESHEHDVEDENREEESPHKTDRARHHRVRQMNRSEADEPNRCSFDGSKSGGSWNDTGLVFSWLLDCEPLVVCNNPERAQEEAKGCHCVRLCEERFVVLVFVLHFCCHVHWGVCSRVVDCLQRNRPLLA